MFEEHQRQFTLSRTERLAEFRRAAAAPDDDMAVRAAENFLNLFPSRDRPLMTYELISSDRVRPEIAWRIIHAHWASFDAIPQALFSRLFASLRDDWNASFLGKEDRGFFETLPERVAIFRGQSAYYAVGLSWTIDRAIAEGFARGLPGSLNKAPRVISAHVFKSNIAGAYTTRGESAITVFHSRFALDRR